MAAHQGGLEQCSKLQGISQATHVQDAEASASHAETAKAALGAAQADMDQCCSRLKHLEHIQIILEAAEGDGTDMAKQLAELRCASNELIR